MCVNVFVKDICCLSLCVFISLFQGERYCLEKTIETCEKGRKCAFWDHTCTCAYFSIVDRGRYSLGANDGDATKTLKIVNISPFSFLVLVQLHHFCDFFEKKIWGRKISFFAQTSPSSRPFRNKFSGNNLKDNVVESCFISFQLDAISFKLNGNCFRLKGNCFKLNADCFKLNANIFLISYKTSTLQCKLFQLNAECFKSNAKCCESHAKMFEIECKKE